MNEPRLSIHSVTGASNLFFQVNYSDEEKAENKIAYEVLKILLVSYLRQRYERLGLEKFKDKSFYEIRLTDNWKGFCLSVKWGGGVNEEEALKIFSDALEYVKIFEPTQCQYENEKLKEMVFDHIEVVKKNAEALTKQIIDEKSYQYKSDFWDPFD